MTPPGEPRLGFSVNALLPKARGGGALRMGLVALDDSDWLQQRPDLAARKAVFDAHPESVQTLPVSETAGQELAALLGVEGGLDGAARSAWEDMCLLLPDAGGVYRLVGAAVAFPTDWHPAEKLGQPLIGLHRPIHGYAEKLASGVDHFMASLKPGRIFGRCNWFVSPTAALRWIDTAPPSHTFADVTAANAGTTLFVRSERQTLRRLPETGAIVFTIGVYIEALEALTADNLAWLAAAVSTIPPEEAHRRGADYWKQQLVDYANSRTVPSP